MREIGLKRKSTARCLRGSMFRIAVGHVGISVAITVRWQNGWTNFWVSLHFGDVESEVRVTDGLATLGALGAELRRQAGGAWEAVALAFAIARRAERADVVWLVDQHRVEWLSAVVVRRVGLGRRPAGSLLEKLRLRNLRRILEFRPPATR